MHTNLHSNNNTSNDNNTTTNNNHKRITKPNSNNNNNNNLEGNPACFFQNRLIITDDARSNCSMCLSKRFNYLSQYVHVYSFKCNIIVFVFRPASSRT